jgi:sporulation protein YlmC with PRC-barrel domain
MWHFSIANFERAMSRTSKGTGHMHSHRGSGFIMATAVASLMSSAALAQDAQPDAEAIGQWRASKMVGLNVYNNDNEKIGDIAELIIDRSGKLEAVVVGAGGFLGIGERYVAVPYSQINWVFAHAAAHHHHQAEHHHVLGEHEEAKQHATAAQEHSELAHKHTTTAYTHSHK